MSAPVNVLVIIKSFEKLGEGLLALLLLNVGDDVDQLEVSLGELGSLGSNASQLDAESLVSGLGLVSVSDYLDLNDLLSLSSQEANLA